MSGPTTLAALPRGSSAVVLGYADGPLARRRFIEMGLVPGARVTRLHSAPLGDPLVYAVLGTRLAVRSRDAQIVMVEAAP
ncbi:MAG: FeoA family protein [Acidimicrobiia bacterium]|jgi:Fe2+ transport system protein FeoA